VYPHLSRTSNFHQSLESGYWLFVIGYLLFVIGYLLFVIGYLLFVIGYWLFVIGYLLVGTTNNQQLTTNN
jgi:CHASE2 domain-containing sensor protein